MPRRIAGTGVEGFATRAAVHDDLRSSAPERPHEQVGDRARVGAVPAADLAPRLWAGWEVSSSRLGKTEQATQDRRRDGLRCAAAVETAGVAEHDDADPVSGATTIAERNPETTPVSRAARLVASGDVSVRDTAETYGA
jgi:hypothetical protein